MRFSGACIKVLGYVTERKFGMGFVVMCGNVPCTFEESNVSSNFISYM